jgi:hypothetical protein
VGGLGLSMSNSEGGSWKVSCCFRIFFSSVDRSVNLSAPDGLGYNTVRGVA